MLRKTVSYDCTKTDTLKFFKHYQEIPEWHEILHALLEKYIFWFIIFSPYFPCVFHWFWVLTCESPILSAIADNIGTSPSEQYSLSSLLFQWSDQIQVRARPTSLQSSLRYKYLPCESHADGPKS